MLTRRQHGKSTQPVPVWLAALIAADCLATDGSRGRAVPWVCASGRAVYTNAGPTAERIEPLGVSLERGQTLAVWWRPGETAYSLEVYEAAWPENRCLNPSLPAMTIPRSPRPQPRDRRRAALAPTSGAVPTRSAASAA